MLFPPVVIMPDSYKTLSKIPFNPYGGKITKDERTNIVFNEKAKHILCFIGGFFDTYYKVVFHAFQASVAKQHSCNPLQSSSTHALEKKIPQFCSTLDSKKPLNPITDQLCLMYISFNCFSFLHDFIANTHAQGYKISCIAHSWGAKNILRLCLRYNPAIEYLITLDCVGHFRITHRPTNIKVWENIYIPDHLSTFSQANLAAMIGGAKQKIIYADSNIPIPPPANHASVPTMLQHSNIFGF